MLPNRNNLERYKPELSSWKDYAVENRYSGTASNVEMGKAINITAEIRDIVLNDLNGKTK